MGNLVADAMLDETKPQGIQIAIANGGGLRASIDQGNVSMGEVLTVLPFQNTIATFKLKGEDVKAALENGVSQVADGAGRFPQVAGLKYTFDIAKPVGQRVSAIEVENAGKFVPLDPATTYGVVSNNYTRSGGDGYDIFKTKAVGAYDYGPNLENVVAAFIGKHSPYTPYIDGRITAVTVAEAAKPVVTEAKPVTTAEAKPVDTAAKPATPAESTMAAKQTKHTVAKGDTYWDLAKSYYGAGADWRKIREANAMRPRALRIGAELVIPAK